MPLIHLVIVLIVVGVLLWAANMIPYIDANIKKIINVVVIVATVLWILSLFVGNFGSIGNIHVGRLR